MRILIITVSVLLASCSNFSNYLPTFTPHKIEIRQGNLITQDMRDRIKVGMTQAQVKAVLGAPLRHQLRLPSRTREASCRHGIDLVVHSLDASAKRIDGLEWTEVSASQSIDDFCRRHAD